MGGNRANRLSSLEISDGFEVLNWAIEDATDAFSQQVDSQLAALASPEYFPLRWENDPHGVLMHPYYPTGIGLSPSSRGTSRKCALTRAPHAGVGGEDVTAICGNAFDAFCEIDDAYFVLAAFEKGIPGAHLYSRVRETYGNNLFTRVGANLPATNLGLESFRPGNGAKTVGDSQRNSAGNHRTYYSVHSFSVSGFTAIWAAGARKITLDTS